MPRFAILEHDWPSLHWDFLLESGGVLRAWRVLAEPTPGTQAQVEPIGDHRLLYLDYEGAVSNNRGTVKRWDAGTFEWLTDTAERVEVVLQGKRVKGRVVIEGGRVWFS